MFSFGSAMYGQYSSDPTTGVTSEVTSNITESQANGQSVSGITMILFLIVFGYVLWLAIRSFRRYLYSEDDMPPSDSSSSNHYALKKVDNSGIHVALASFANLLTPIYLTPDGLAVSVTELRKYEGNWHIIINVANMTRYDALFKLDSVVLKWGLFSKSSDDVLGFCKIPTNGQANYHLVVKSRKYRFPTGLSMLINDNTSYKSVIEQNLTKNRS